MPQDETLNDDQDESKLDDVETPDKGEDETTDEDEDKEEDDDSQDDDDSEDEDDSDKDEDEDEDEPKFKKAFSQIKGDTPEEYATNLEEAYRQSSQEGKLKAKELKDAQSRIDAITAAVAKDPKLAKALADAVPDGEIAPTADPALLHARQTMEEQMDKDYTEFSDLHPEIASDPDLQDKMLAEVQVFGDAARKKGRIMPMKEALNKAWISLGLDKDDSKEKVVTKAKDNASKPKTNNSKKSGKTPQLTPDQIKVGKKMGLTEKQMLEQLKS